MTIMMMILLNDSDNDNDDDDDDNVDDYDNNNNNTKKNSNIVWCLQTSNCYVYLRHRTICAVLVTCLEKAYARRY
jgi:hypothetical protein